MSDIVAIFNWAMLGASAITFGAYGCRLGLFNIGIHKTGPILIHIMLGSLTFSVGQHAWYGAAGLDDVLGLGSAAALIILSYKDWKGGVPKRAWRDAPIGMAAALHDLNDLLHGK